MFGGVDVKVWQADVSQRRRAISLVEGARPDSDFSAFDPIDLAGFKVTAGIHYMF